MAAFLILLHDDDVAGDNDAVRERIAKCYPDNYEFSPHVFFVNGPRLTSEVAKATGITDADGHKGAIVSLNGSFTGRSWGTLWEWLRTANQPQ